jgi:hypothetical protein
LGAPGFGLRELVVVGGTTWVEAAESVDPPMADQGLGAGGLVVHLSIMRGSVRHRSAELERKNR